MSKTKCPYCKLDFSDKPYLIELHMMKAHIVPNLPKVRLHL